MLEFIFAASLLSSSTTNPIKTISDHYQTIHAYQATIKTSSNGKTSIMRYSFKKPGHVRMDFTTPFNGGVLIYDPDTKYVHLWPLGYQTIPALILDPKNPMAQCATGQRVDHSDVGHLYAQLKTLQDNGTVKIIGMDNIDGQDVLHISISNDNGPDPDAIVQYQLWLDCHNGFPLKLIGYVEHERISETTEIKALIINPDFPADFFRQ